MKPINPTAEFFKVAWMTFWRVVVVAGLFTKASFGSVLLVSFIVATGLVFVGKKSIFTWPLWKLLRRKPVIFDLSGAKPTAPKPGTKKAPAPAQTKTSQTGRKTGYEPSAMASVPMPTPQTYDRMRGKPGGGLSHASFSGTQQAKVGAEGEQLFAKALAHNGFLSNMDSYWSVSMPSADSLTPDRRFDTDIDCILIRRNRITLIDVKMYAGGNGTYRHIDPEHIALFDNATGAQVGPTHKLSRNMEMATDRMKKLLPGYKIRSMVVFVPTDRGMANIPAGSIKWPGGIPAMSLPEFFSTVQPPVVPALPVPDQLDASLRRLLRG